MGVKSISHKVKILRENVIEASRRREAAICEEHGSRKKYKRCIVCSENIYGDVKRAGKVVHCLHIDLRRPMTGYEEGNYGTVYGSRDWQRGM